MKKVGINAMIVAVSVLAALVLGEGVLRLAGFSYPSFFVPDDITGSRLRAGMAGWHRSEGVAYVKINSEGLRDREHAIAKPAGTVRIAVLGDSFSEALSVPQEAAFWAILERKLNECKAFGGKPVEVINFGVSGYGTAQELLTLRHRAAAYSPDLVLLAFFSGNDVRNNSKSLEPEKARPFYVLREGQLVLDQSFLSDSTYQEAKRVDARRAMLHDVRLYQLLRRVKAGELQLRHNAPIAVAMAKGDAAGPLEAGLDENVLREPSDPAWREAWAVTDRLILAMRDESRKQGARFMVAVLPTAGSVFPDPAWRSGYMAKLGIADLFYPERRLQALGTQNGFEVLALAPAMQRHADESRTYLHGFSNTMMGFGHWNAAGHDIAGKLIARQLCPAAI